MPAKPKALGYPKSHSAPFGSFSRSLFYHSRLLRHTHCLVVAMETEENVKNLEGFKWIRWQRISRNCSNKFQHFNHRSVFFLVEMIKWNFMNQNFYYISSPTSSVLSWWRGFIKSTSFSSLRRRKAIFETWQNIKICSDTDAEHINERANDEKLTQMAE